MKPVLERLQLRRFRDEDGKELLDLPRAPLPDPETPAPVRFLPTWDAILLVHARRTGVIDEEYRKRIFHVKVPQSFPTFLVDGRVAGTWKHDKGRVQFEPFERIRVRRDERSPTRPSGSRRSTPTRGFGEWPRRRGAMGECDARTQGARSRSVRADARAPDDPLAAVTSAKRTSALPFPS